MNNQYQPQRPNFIQPHMPTRPPTQPNMQTRQTRPTVSMQQQNTQYGNQYPVQQGMTTMFLNPQSMQPGMTGTRVITVAGSSQQMAPVQFPQYTINTTSPPQFQVTPNTAMYYSPMMTQQGQVYYTGQQAPPGAPMQPATQTRAPLNQMTNHSYMQTQPQATMGGQPQALPKKKKVPTATLR